MKIDEAPDAVSVEETAWVNRKAGSSILGHGVECFALAWTAGLLAAFLDRIVPAMLLFLAALAAVWFADKRRCTAQCAAAVIGFSLGMLLWAGYDIMIRQPVCAMAGKTVECTGYVTDITEIRGGRSVYTLRTKIAGHTQSIDWYADTEQPQIRISDTVVLKAALSAIEPDYRYHTAEYQAGKGKYLRIYDAEVIAHQPGSGFLPRRMLRDYRVYIKDLIYQKTAPQDAALLCAMIFGDKSGLDSETSDLLQHSGIGHIAVVSGLHLVMFCAVLGRLLRRTSARLRFLLLALGMAVFILLVDASVSVFRAALMLLIANAAGLFRRERDTLRSLSLAVLICTAAAPYVIGSASFWLTVSAVLGIGVIAPYLTNGLKCPRIIKDLLSFCCVSAAVFPAALLLCGESSVLAPFCNLLILPAGTLALCIGFLLLLTGGLTAFLLPSAGILCQCVRAGAGLLTRLPFAYLQAAEPPVLVSVLLGAVILLTALAAGIGRKQFLTAFLAVCTALSCIAAFSTAMSARQLRVALLGGSKQAAAVISLGGTDMVIDLTDQPRNAQYTAAYLERYGMTHPALLILNKGRAAAGYQEAFAGFDVQSALIRGADEWREDCTFCGVQPKFCGDDEMKITFDTAEITLSGEKIRICWNGMTVDILPSDSGEASKANAVIRYGEPLCSFALAGSKHPAAGNNMVLRLTKNGRGDVIPA
ncbi:MAG: competence protein ComEC family protein [Oscillospiraceae bacterium]|nr:competence protein ComEC family protein [Oscillospiraceae bacterium]